MTSWVSAAGGGTGGKQADVPQWMERRRAEQRRGERREMSLLVAERRQLFFDVESEALVVSQWHHLLQGSGSATNSYKVETKLKTKN